MKIFIFFYVIYFIYPTPKTNNLYGKWQLLYIEEFNKYDESLHIQRKSGTILPTYFIFSKNDSLSIINGKDTIQFTVLKKKSKLSIIKKDEISTIDFSGNYRLFFFDTNLRLEKKNHPHYYIYLNKIY